MSDLRNRHAGSDTDVTSAVALDNLHEVRRRGLPTGETASDPRAQVDLFVQTIQDNLRAQVAELERRERNLNEQLVQFDREQRALRFRAQDQEELRLRSEQLEQQEREFAERFQASEQLLAELRLRERELAQAHESLAQQRSSLKQQLEGQLDVDKAAMQHSQALADAERKQLAAERERLQREQNAILETVHTEIDQEKQRLRKEYAWELDGEIEHFRQQRDAWTMQQARDREQLEENKRGQEEAIHKLQVDWSDQRRRQNTDLDATRRQLEQQRQQLLREHDEALRRLQFNWESERQQLRTQWATDLDEEKRQFASEREEFATARDAERAVLQRDREAHDGYLQKSLADLQQQRKQLEIESRRLRDDHAQQIKAENIAVDQSKVEWERLRATEQAQLGDRQREIEAAQQEVARSWQAAQSEIARRQEDLDLREPQLRRFRQRLDERERAIDCESETARRLLANRANDIAAEQRRLERDRADWEQQRLTEQAVFHQQQDQRGRETEKLEARRQRLEIMRSEMEQSNRLALEARLAMEEVWTELLPTVDPETARRRIEAGRAAIAEHFRRLREEIATERQELQLERLQYQDHVRRQHDQLRADREQAPAALMMREEQVRMSERRLRADADEWAKRESQWRSARTQWLEEKLEAERIIRALLDQVAELELDPTRSNKSASVPFYPNAKAA